MAERKLHKHHRLLASAGAVLDNLLHQCVRKGDVNSTLPLQLWIEQKEVFLEESRRTAIALLENTILVRKDETSWSFSFYQEMGFVYSRAVVCL